MYNLIWGFENPIRVIGSTVVAAFSELDAIQKAKRMNLTPPKDHPNFNQIMLSVTKVEDDMPLPLLTFLLNEYHTVEEIIAHEISCQTNGSLRNQSH